ncbi:MAG: DUF192 domain-containing protein [Candidatus Geothermincolia bacterium]
MIASEACFATSGRERTRGLLGRDSMKAGEALIFPKCRQIHTFGMRFAIDVMFLDGHGSVVKAVSDLKPGRLTSWVRSARTTVELPAGTLDSSGTRVADLVKID